MLEGLKEGVMEAIKVIVLLALGMCVVALLIIWIKGVVRMKKDPDYHIWPAVARCRGCGKRIFFWRAHKYMAVRTALVLDGTSVTNIIAGGMLHKSCQGKLRYALKEV